MPGWNTFSKLRRLAFRRLEFVSSFHGHDPSCPIPCDSNSSVTFSEAEFSMIAAVHQSARLSHPLAGRRIRAFERCRRIAVFLETIVSGGKRDRHAERCFISVPQFSMTPSKDSVKPVHVIRLRGITASVFANTAETKNGDVTFHKVSVQRTYKRSEERRVGKEC